METEHEHGEDCTCASHKAFELKIERRTKEELAQIAKDMVEGKIFCDRHLKGDDIEMLSKIFVPLALGAISSLTEEKQNDIGMIFEHIDNDMAIIEADKNGEEVDHSLPLFMSMQIIHTEDLDIFIKMGQEEFAKRNADS
jgi:hypothetical protein